LSPLNMTSHLHSPDFYFRIIDNNKLTRGSFSNGSFNGEQIVKTQPGMRRATPNPFTKAYEKEDEKFLLISYRFAVNLLPGVSFPATIVSIGYLDALSVWILCANGYFSVYDVPTCTPKLIIKKILKDDKFSGCIDAAYSAGYQHLFILREDGDVAFLKFKRDLQDFVQECCLEIDPPPDEDSCARPLRILTSVGEDGNEFVFSIFADGRIDLMVYDGEKLILLDSVLTSEKLIDALIFKSEKEVTLLLFDQAEKKFAAYIDCDEGLLSLSPKKKDTKSLIREDDTFLKFQLDDSVTTTDLVYLGESLKSQLPSPPEKGNEFLKSCLFPVNTKSASMVKLYIEGQIDPLLNSLNVAISQLVAKATQELTFVLCLKKQLEKEKEIKNPPKVDISSLKTRMDRLIKKIERIENVQDKGLQSKLTEYTKRVKEMTFKLEDKKIDLSVDDLTRLLENRAKLVASQSNS
jgi:hypothetical protein